MVPASLRCENVSAAAEMPRNALVRGSARPSGWIAAGSPHGRGWIHPFRGTFGAMKAASCTVALAVWASLPGCLGAAAPVSAPSQELPVATPDVELRDAKTTLVGGRPVGLDGVAEGLVWPALAAAVNRPRGNHAPLVIAVGRDVPLSLVLRAVWTLRDADVRVQTADARGEVRVLELRPRPDSTTETGCHLAVFVAGSGDLRVAAPGGPRPIAGPDAADALARALAKERTACTLRYVGFGADAPDAPWASVFDVARAVDRDKAAGDARYVLAEPIP
jgi:hypothetical protein